MANYKLSLHGSGTKGTSIKASLLSIIVQTVVEGAKASVRLRVEGRSIMPGTPPAWIDKVCDFDFTGIAAGSTVLEFDCAPLFELDGERFGQINAFSGIPAGATALSLFSEGLEDAAAGKQDSDNYDEGLLNIYTQLANVYSRGIDRISFSNGQRTAAGLDIVPQTIETIKQLKRETPAPQAVRLAGHVDSIRASNRMFELVLTSGEKLKAIAPAETGTEQMKDFFGQYAVLSGKAVFRPNGTVLRIEATGIDLDAAQSQEVWSVMPKPRMHALFLRGLQVAQTSENGLSKIWGQWPGSETDEEVQQALCL